MTSRDIEVQGAVAYFITDKRYYPRVRPFLVFQDYHQFLLQYYERCLRDDPKGTWALSRYPAGWGLANWFSGLWDDPGVSRGALVDLKGMLARLYQEGDTELRTCLVTATLEHLFERPDIAEFFADWKDEPTLRRAHEQATEWARRMGKSRRGDGEP